MPWDRCFDMQHSFIFPQLCKLEHFEVQKGWEFKVPPYCLSGCFLISTFLYISHFKVISILLCSIHPGYLTKHNQAGPHLLLDFKVIQPSKRLCSLGHTCLYVFQYLPISQKSITFIVNYFPQPKFFFPSLKPLFDLILEYTTQIQSPIFMCNDKHLCYSNI